MKTKEEVREDLKEIRYYCSKQRDFENAAKTIGSSAAIEKVKAYNEAIQTAPIRLYDLYVSLYVNNNTQAVVAEDWGISCDYVRKLTKNLYEYFMSALDKGGEQ